MPHVDARQLSKTFPIGGGQLRVLTDASLQLNRGESCAVIGPSGSGKSTLLTMLGTLEHPTSGTLEIDGVRPFELDSERLAGFRSRHIGFVFQEHYLLPQCSVLENLLTPLLADGSATAADVRRAEQLADRVGLAHRLSHRPAELSGGERQRAAIARALIRGPSVLLADEPTGNLDRSTAADVAELLLELQQEQQAVLVTVTHSSELAAKMQQRFEIDDGKLAAL